jgi:hypothetical protein
MFTALLAMFHLCGAQIGTELHQGKLQIGKSGSAVVPAFVTELCFRAVGCQGIAAPPEAGITNDFFVSPDFNAYRDELAKTRTGCRQAPENPPLPALAPARNVTAALTSTPDPADVIHNTRHELTLSLKTLGAENPTAVGS